MEKELQRKIAWFEERHSKQKQLIDSLENARKLDRSSAAHKQLKDAKKEKLRLKDHITWLKKLESQLPKDLFDSEEPP